MPVYQYICTNKDCSGIDLVKRPDNRQEQIKPMSQCEQDQPCKYCSSPAKWVDAKYHRFGENSNQCSLAFHFNFLE